MRLLGARPVARALAAAGTSLALHLAALLALRWVSALPDVGFELELPAEVELGIVDEPAQAPPAAAPVEPPPEPPPQTPLAASAAQADPAAPAEPKPPKPAKRKPKKPADGGVPPEPDALPMGEDGEPAPLLAAYAPKGALLSLRVDMDRVRDSSLAQDARELLQAIPDFQRLLDGSGVDPLDDLSRLFIASPNLQRESVVLAGKYVGDEDVPRRAAEALASARGKTVKWRTRGGIPTAAWENDDVTPRVLALLGPALFAITRPDDLPRILGVARALAARDARERPDGGSPADPADALLAMQEHEVVVLSVDNAKTFARGNAEHVPERLQISILLTEGERVEVRSRATFPSAAEAQDALTFWADAQRRFARHPLLALSGMSAPLRETNLAAQDATLTATTQLSVDQAQRILRFARDALAVRASQRPVAPPAPGQ